PGFVGTTPAAQGMGDLRNEFVHTACLVGGEWRSCLSKCRVQTAVAGVGGCIDAPVHQALG
ncbi:MAG: hypothetical protein LC799_35310, partial [Actinobacteria bacterium]|nr:hypothetical protein [Actinomycetota bacterium]